MNVAILHFHLRRGGVGTVMRAQAASLAKKDSFKVAFIVGAAPEAESPVPIEIVPGMDYDGITGTPASDLEAGAARLASSLKKAIARAFPDGCDLVHVHNPLLRKNARLLGALRILRREGLALLVQEHDFAEDFRPDVYDTFWPYPDSCDYATINSRDRDNLVAAGLDPGRVHLLPNPIVEAGPFIPREGAAVEIARGRRKALYPVRAIRRKNIGEALLLSLFLPEGAELAITLPPTSPGDRSQYEAWKAFASERNMPLRFDAGKDATLAELYERSFIVVSTSVKEGFGYSFLEPLARGLPIAGREISHIANDFKEKGIAFENLYRRIGIPADAVGLRGLRAAAASRISRMREAFGPAFAQADRLESALDALEHRFEGESLDFGSLDAESQRRILDRALRDTGFAANLKEMNPFLDGIFERCPAKEELRARRDAALSSYSELNYGELLAAAYEAAAGRASSGRLDKAALVERYLKPEEFFLSAT